MNHNKLIYCTDIDLFHKDQLFHINIIFLKSETPLSFVLGLIRIHNHLISGQTPKPSCLGARQKDSCLPKVLIVKVRGIEGGIEELIHRLLLYSLSLKTNDFI